MRPNAMQEWRERCGLTTEAWWWRTSYPSPSGLPPSPAASGELPREEQRRKEMVLDPLVLRSHECGAEVYDVVGDIADQP